MCNFIVDFGIFGVFNGVLFVVVFGIVFFGFVNLYG